MLTQLPPVLGADRRVLLQEARFRPEASLELLHSRGPHLPGGPWLGAPQEHGSLGPTRERGERCPPSPRAVPPGWLPRHTQLPEKLPGWHKWPLPQGTMSPVLASTDVKIRQEFHSFLVKIHCQSIWLSSAGTPPSSVTSLSSHGQPLPPWPGTPLGRNIAQSWRGCYCGPLTETPPLPGQVGHSGVSLSPGDP